MCRYGNASRRRVAGFFAAFFGDKKLRCFSGIMRRKRPEQNIHVFYKKSIIPQKRAYLTAFVVQKKRIKTHYFHEIIDVKTISKVHISVQKHIFRSESFIFNFLKIF